MLRQIGVGVISALLFAGGVFAQEAVPLGQAIRDRKIQATVTALGGSSGDAILLTVRRIVPEPLRLSLTPGIVFTSKTGKVQNMAGARIKGERTGATTYSPSDTIYLGDDADHLYIVEAYCMDFNKANPGAGDAFAWGEVDARAAEILNLGRAENTKVVQSALWFDREKIDNAALKRRFPVNDQEIEAARALLQKLREAQSAPAAAPPPNASVPDRKPKRNEAPGGAVYHFKPELNIEGMVSRNLTIEETTEERKGTAREKGEMAMMIDASGKIKYMPETLNATGIQIKVNQDFGHTTYAGLKFKESCTVNIWADGTVEVDRAGVPAVDAGNARYISRLMTIGGKEAAVMVSEGGQSAAAADAAPRERAPLVLRPGDTHTLSLAPGESVALDYQWDRPGDYRLSILTASASPMKLQSGSVVFAISADQPLVLGPKEGRGPLVLTNAGETRTPEFTASLSAPPESNSPPPLKEKEKKPAGAEAAPVPPPQAAPAPAAPPSPATGSGAGSQRDAIICQWENVVREKTAQ